MEINQKIIDNSILSVDTSLYNHFKNVLNITCEVNGVNEKVPIHWATGERWSQIKNKNMLRDANGSLILPIITIYNTGMSDDPTFNVLGGLPSSEDFVLSNVAERNAITSGASRLVTVMKYPKQFSCTYEVNIWAQYIKQINQIVGYLVSNQPFQQHFCFNDSVTGKYRYTAYVDAPINSKDNMSDVGQNERIIIKTFTFRVTFPLITEESGFRRERVMVKIKESIEVI